MRNATWLALALAACTANKANVQPEHSEALPFIEDDWPKALEAAKTSGKPVFVDTWAPW